MTRPSPVCPSRNPTRHATTGRQSRALLFRKAAWAETTDCGASSKWSAPPFGFSASFLLFPRPRQWHNGVVTPGEGKELLAKYKAGKLAEDEVLRAFQAAPVIEFDFAKVDTHRALRKGFPEVIFGSGKTAEQIVTIATAILSQDKRVLITRVNAEQSALLTKQFPNANHYKEARIVAVQEKPLEKNPGAIAVVCAGTSDLPVAEEAAVTADTMGNTVQRFYDV